MQSSLPRPGGSRLPAPASISQPLVQLQESNLNSRIGLAKPDTLSKSTLPSLVKTPAVPRASALKRPASVLDYADERPAQIARSAITQTGAIQKTQKSGKVSSTLKHGSASGVKVQPSKNPARPQTSMLTSRQQSIPEAEVIDDENTISSSASAMKKRTQRPGWDIKGRLGDLEEDHRALMEKFTDVAEQKDVSGMKVIELETIRATLETRNSHLTVELEREKSELNKFRVDLQEEQRLRRNDQDEARRRLLNETDELRRKARDDAESTDRSHKQDISDLLSRHNYEIDQLKRLVEQMKLDSAEEKRQSNEKLSSLKSQSASEIESIIHKSRSESTELSRQHELEMLSLKTKYESEINTLKYTLQGQVTRLESELQSERAAHESVKEDLSISQRQNKELRSTLSEQSISNINMESSARALRDKLTSLESLIKEKDSFLRLKDHSNADMQRRVDEAMAKLRSEETLRRKLHNQVLELKGNIRVFCRVRPVLGNEMDVARIEFPDVEEEAKDIKLFSAEQSAMGVETIKEHPFSFDKVFNPSCDNNLIFEEISQLVQSALDGYNVCIFAYGQTGSGKTHTMTSKDGMIPQAVEQIFQTSLAMNDKGWTYKMEGSFVEVYNENLNDLLGKDTDLDKKKLEIRHDKGRTSIIDCTSITLDAPSKMEEVMRRAAANRMVAATKANERSSRSHSVFILKLIGVNSVTGERCEGNLNLVDLAGSERLSHSQSTGDRLKETQNINKSLSALGDVISALGSGKDGKHIPYRNSKLTYLLQNSLGGNSKTLMFVMVSPMAGHLSETLTSLKFAKKVSQVNIGTAKRVKVENTSP